MTPVSNEIGAGVGTLVDNVSRKKRSRTPQRCHSTREISVASVFLQKRSAHGADGPRRISADFGSPRTIFHQIMGHCRHAWKNLDPGVGARFRRMNPKTGEVPIEHTSKRRTISWLVDFSGLSATSTRFLMNPASDRFQKQRRLKFMTKKHLFPMKSKNLTWWPSRNPIHFYGVGG